MDHDELLQRILRWENLHTEFKEWPVSNHDLAAALVAFANADGGQLVLGVRDDRRIVGLSAPDAVMQRIDQVAYQNCEPPLTIVQETIQIPSQVAKPVLVVNVPKGEQRPYCTNRGIYYVRTASSRRQASRQELLRLFQATESLFYDETALLRASLDDLDRQAVQRFVRSAYGRSLDEFGLPYERLLVNFRLAVEKADRLVPTVAALLFFGLDPQRFLPYATIAAAAIPGIDLAAAPFDTKSLTGTLPVMLEDANRFLKIHLRVAHRIEGFGPERYPELPEAALREMLVNALAHRDYAVHGPVRLLIYDDRVDIRTPGGLPNSVTVDAIKLGAAHMLRNPTVYTLFSRLGLVTGIGSGVYRTIQLVREATGREPAFAVEGNEFTVSLPRAQRVQT
jgi:ATP-dependent DNA helicase RecG